MEADEQQRAAVLAVLSGMPEKDRGILSWWYFEGMDKGEICRLLNVDRDYLRVLLHRAKVSFRIEYLKRQESANAGRTAGAGGYTAWSWKLWIMIRRWRRKRRNGIC